ncbi:uncharacterized protein LOC144707831 isoform X1 [Wolffia australiana]
MAAPALVDVELAAAGENEGEKESRKKTLSLIPLIFIIFFEVSGGAYGAEPTVQAAGPLLAMIGFVVFPFVWSVPEALITAELATAFAGDGGYVSWVTAAFGPFPGFLMGTWKYFTCVINNAAYPVLCADYLSRISHRFSGGSAVRDGTITGLAVVLSLVNYTGLAIVGWGSVALGLAAMAPFVVMAAAALPKIRPERWLRLPETRMTRADWSLYLNTLFWNLNYWDSVSTLAGEVKNPKKTLPRALLTAGLLICIGYLVPLLATTGALQLSQDQWTDGFFADAAGKRSSLLFYLSFSIGYLFVCLSLSLARSLSLSIYRYFSFPRPKYQSLPIILSPSISYLCLSVCLSVCLSLSHTFSSPSISLRPDTFLPLSSSILVALSLNESLALFSSTLSLFTYLYISPSVSLYTFSVFLNVYNSHSQSPSICIPLAISTSLYIFPSLYQSPSLSLCLYLSLLFILSHFVFLRQIYPSVNPSTYRSIQYLSLGPKIRHDRGQMAQGVRGGRRRSVGHRAVRGGAERVLIPAAGHGGFGPPPALPGRPIGVVRHAVAGHHRVDGHHAGFHLHEVRRHRRGGQLHLRAEHAAGVRGLPLAAAEEAAAEAALQSARQHAVARRHVHRALRLHRARHVHGQLENVRRQRRHDLARRRSLLSIQGPQGQEMARLRRPPLH